MMTIVSIILILTIINSLLIAWAIVHDRYYRIDAKRIGGVIAANLIDAYGDELIVLNEQGVKKFTRERYIEMCAAFGLPETAVNAVTATVWKTINAAQGNDAEAVYE